MLNVIFLYMASFFLVVWGIAHLFPTRSVVSGFGDISIDNQRIVAMEWINEGATLIFMGGLVAMVTWVDYSGAVSKTVYRLSFLMLNAMSVISLFTGFKISFLPYKLCPIVFSSTSVLLILGCYL